MDELELALDDCLQRLASGKASLAQCLARYPKHAAELRPMLEAALELQRGKTIRPSGAMRDRTRAKVLNHIQAHPRKPRKALVVPRLAFMIAVLACGLLAVVTSAAQAAMPGQTLYGWKLSSERAWRAVAPDPVAADLFLADRHANELIAVASQSSSTPGSATEEGMEASAEAQAMGAYVEVLDRLVKETKGTDASVILRKLQEHHSKLMQVGIHVERLDEFLSQAPFEVDQAKGNSPLERLTSLGSLAGALRGLRHPRTPPSGLAVGVGKRSHKANVQQDLRPMGPRHNHLRQPARRS